LLAQLTDGIAFDEPTLEPHKPACESRIGAASNKRSTATAATEQLAIVRGVTVPLDTVRAAANTQRFCAMVLSSRVSIVRTKWEKLT
jgi:hypothetical protein